jgi:glyoxylase-like metal-dependent hydrolase (beta-lactamase superfamily II)
MNRKSLMAFTALSPLLVFTGLAFAQNLPPGLLPEESTRISDHVYEIKGFPNIGIVVGTRATLVVDNGLGKRNGETIMRVVKKIGDRPMLYLTNTHFHPEHAAGDAGFPANTILVRSTAQQEEMNQNGQNMLKMFAGFNKEYGELLAGATLRPPDLVFENQLKLDLGGVTARILWYGAAHTKGDQLIFVEPDSVLISGDVVQNKIVPAVPGGQGNIGSWLRVLDQLATLKPRIVMPTHSSNGDGSLIAREKAFIVDMRTRTLALKQQGVPVEDAAKRLTETFKTNYPEWAASKEWNNVGGVADFVRAVYAEAK